MVRKAKTAPENDGMEKTFPVARQTMIAGTHDDIPEEVQSAAEAYIGFKRAVAKNREKMNAALDALILRMKQADIAEMLIDDGDKKLVLATKDLVKIKARKKNKDGTIKEEDEDSL